VAVDPTTGKVFVADHGNHRVLRYPSATALRNGDPAEGVLGQADFVSASANRGGAPAANTLYHPLGLAVDSAGRLWVADSINQRVLRFDNAATKADGANADGVFGQPDFTSNANTTTPSGMWHPYDVFVDDAGRLWVADMDNHRVLRFDDAASKANGANADGVLGQLDFGSRGTATTQNGMTYPLGVVVAADGTLFVADGYNYRVLRFNNAAAKANGADADGVLGQPDFTSNAVALTQSGMYVPWGLALDPDGRLFVADRYHHRILIYDGAANKANGADADGVLGQPDFTTGTPNTGGRSAATLSQPIWLWYDPALPALWVSDYGNHRVLAYGFGLTVNTAGSGTGATEDPAPAVPEEAAPPVDVRLTEPDPWVGLTQR
jgi:sugar lactone lactonase YvrE